MADVTLSGYLASPIAVTWVGATQKIDSLTNTEWTDLSDEIDNSSTLYALADIELVLGSAAFAGTPVMEIYVVPTVDGTNYPTWSGNATADAPEQSHLLASVLPLKVITAAQRTVNPTYAPIELPNGKFKFGIRSRAGVTLAASGNTLSFRPHTVTT